MITIKAGGFYLRTSVPAPLLPTPSVPKHPLSGDYVLQRKSCIRDTFCFFFSDERKTERQKEKNLTAPRCGKGQSLL